MARGSDKTHDPIDDDMANDDDTGWEVSDPEQDRDQTDTVSSIDRAEPSLKRKRESAGARTISIDKGSLSGVRREHGRITSKHVRNKFRRNVGILGFSASGKTVFLSMLYHATAVSGRFDRQWRAEWSRYDDGNSARYLRDVSRQILGLQANGRLNFVDASQLKVSRQFPRGTEHATDIVFDLIRKWGLMEFPLHIKTLDYAGEAVHNAFLQGINDLNRGHAEHWNAIVELCASSDALLLFFNILTIHDLQNAGEMTLLAEWICRQPHRPKRIAIVVTGIDVIHDDKELMDYRLKVAEKYRVSFDMLESHGIATEIFMVSSLGRNMVRKRSLGLDPDCMGSEHLCPKCQELVDDPQAEPHPIGMSAPLDYIFKAKLPLRFRWFPLAVFFGLLFRLRILIFKSMLTPLIVGGSLAYGAWKYVSFGKESVVEVQQSLLDGSPEVMAGIPDKMAVLSRWYGWWKNDSISDLSNRIRGWEEWLKLLDYSNRDDVTFSERLDALDAYIQKSAGSVWMESAQHRYAKLSYDHDLSLLSTGSIHDRLIVSVNVIGKWQNSLNLFDKVLQAADNCIADYALTIWTEPTPIKPVTIGGVHSRRAELMRSYPQLVSLAKYLPSAAGLVDKTDDELGVLLAREAELRAIQERIEYDQTRKELLSYLEAASFDQARKAVAFMLVEYPSLYGGDKYLSNASRWIKVGLDATKLINLDSFAEARVALGELRSINTKEMNAAASILQEKLHQQESTYDLRVELGSLTKSLAPRMSNSFKADLEVYGGRKGRDYLDRYEQAMLTSEKLTKRIELLRELQSEFASIEQFVSQSEGVFRIAEDFQILSRTKGDVVSDHAPMSWAMATGMYNNAVATREANPSAAMIQISNAIQKVENAYPEALERKKKHDILADLKKNIQDTKSHLSEYNPEFWSTLPLRLKDVENAADIDTSLRKAVLLRRDIEKAVNYANTQKSYAMRAKELREELKASLQEYGVSFLERWNSSGLKKVKAITSRAEKSVPDYESAIRYYLEAIELLKKVNGLAEQKQRNSHKEGGGFGG